MRLPSSRVIISLTFVGVFLLALGLVGLFVELTNRFEIEYSEPKTTEAKVSDVEFTPSKREYSYDLLQERYRWKTIPARYRVSLSFDGVIHTYRTRNFYEYFKNHNGKSLRIGYREVFDVWYDRDSGLEIGREFSRYEVLLLPR